MSEWLEFCVSFKSFVAQSWINLEHFQVTTFLTAIQLFHTIIIGLHEEKSLNGTKVMKVDPFKERSLKEHLATEFREHQYSV